LLLWQVSSSNRFLYHSLGYHWQRWHQFSPPPWLASLSQFPRNSLSLLQRFSLLCWQRWQVKDHSNRRWQRFYPF